MNIGMEANRVAKEFWNEVFDLRSPVQDARGKRAARVRQKKLRRLTAIRPTDRPSA